MTGPDQQILALGYGVELDGSMTEGTRESGLAAARYIIAHSDNVVRVDFSGRYSCYSPTPASGFEADHLDQVAYELDMPRAGIVINHDREADDTTGNWTYGVRRGHLDSRLETHVAVNTNHWPRVDYLGSMAMPRTRIFPIYTAEQPNRTASVRERVLLAGYRHVMRHVTPGDIDGIDEASSVMRRAAMSVLNPSAQPDIITNRDKIGYMWDLIRGEG